MKKFNFYLVSNSRLSKNGIICDVKEALVGGCKIVQYREKNKSTKEMITEAKEIKKICSGKAIFLINDRVDVCLAVGADGVHLGQEDMSYKIARELLGDKIIGLTTHNVEESVNAELKGADYIGLSPIYSTNTKIDAGKACGIEMIKKVRSNVKIPIVAIGGINKENVTEVIKAGANSVVAISAVVCSDNVCNEVKEFEKIIEENK